MNTETDLHIPEAMRKTMRLWASGVVVVCSTHKKMQSGMTVSAFASITLDPPHVLVCINKNAGTLELIRKSKKFSVSILGEDHLDISKQFSGEKILPEGKDRFHNIATFTATTGCPILQESIAWLDCEVFQIRNMSTHVIVGGQVLNTGQTNHQAKPLLYYDRNYRRMSVDHHIE
ncbi:MAG: flavin reductase [Bacteroidetes bacterium]|nr:flavin reductase [Bacteroidota bacterium]MBP8754260.1 flavin reductase [Chitinophagales bacterium]MBK7108093.1 flavin reductase [Bacteroidota bacterium]MBK8486472.1 flavin reductase [Bacteroidota bacterium]MBK8683252.1 flavin reductase [Bacteroidota bacterium]